ncbi:hypothetical protein KP509_11G090900 [Ceratopteris richardii]|uniref:Uncharacterized protein n=1 Tax=Ceratopteris richardii TaxID=49495 RepID=A0A8T2TXZ7_CERRI|nr:hypothetical protein KP509_11G090900 [Ceratopteris richardii]
MVTCLCSPTTHAGSFRCRLHRSVPAHGTIADDYSRSSDGGHESDRGPCLSTPRELPTPLVASPDELRRYSNLSSSPTSSSIRYSASSSSRPLPLSPSSLRSSSNPSLYQPKRSTTSPTAISLPRFPASSPSSFAIPSIIEAARANPRHTAAIVIMKRHLRRSKNLSERGAISRPTAPGKIGLSRFGRVANASNNLVPLNREKDSVKCECPSGRERLSSPCLISSKHSEILGAMKPAPGIDLMVRSRMVEIKESQVACRVLVCKEALHIAPTVY